MNFFAHHEYIYAPITKFSKPELAGITVEPVVGLRRNDVEGGGIGPGHKNIPQWIAGDVVHCGIFVFHDLAVGIR